MLRKALIVSLLLASIECHAEIYKYLQYRVNESTILLISKEPCPFNSLKEEFPFSAAGVSADPRKPKIAGCFKQEDADMLRIQWYKGDYSILPANAFLQLDGIKEVAKIQPKPDL